MNTPFTNKTELHKACAAKANELMANYQGELTSAGLMLLIHEAVLAGAMIAVDTVDQLLTTAITTVTASSATVRVP